MAQLVCVSNAISVTGGQETGDIVGIFEDDVKFNATVLSKFDIYKVPGFTKVELKIELRKQGITKAEMWQDGTEWKKLEEEAKYEFSVKSWSAQDIADLESTLTPVNNKKTIIATVTNRHEELSVNQTVVNS